MTILIRTAPAATDQLEVTAFKLFFPRQLTEEQARAVWTQLKTNEWIVLADPFAIEDISTVFPGVVYDYELNALHVPAALVDALGDEEYLADGWIELWVSEALEDQAEALDVQDLTQPPQL